MNFVDVAIPTPLRTTFTYINKTSQTLLGKRVLVEFGRRKVVGVVIDEKADHNSKYKLKEVLEILDDMTPTFNKSEINQITSIAKAYLHPIGDVVDAFLPTLLRKKKFQSEVTKYENEICDLEINDSSFHHLTKEQDECLEQLNQPTTSKSLIFGITSSGKTEVYKHKVKTVLESGSSALILVPEIFLTPQIYENFKNSFGDSVYIFHSGLTELQRYKVWLAAKSDKPKVIIGTRSAVFLPINNLKTIFFDEEHDQSYRQQDGFRYDARKIIEFLHKDRAQINLASATPSLSTLNKAYAGDIGISKLTKRISKTQKPQIEVVSINKEKLDGGISSKLMQKISKNYSDGNQTLILLNRRGYAPVFLCNSCGWIAKSNCCDSPLVLHQNVKRLKCHRCESAWAIPSTCPDCGENDFDYKGVGTQQVEEALHQYIPERDVIRVDRDSISGKTRREDNIELLKSTDPKVFVGTQLLAKGHDFKKVSLIVVLNLDFGLFGADIHLQEQTIQLLIQVAGRAGRSGIESNVYLQSRVADHPMFALIKSGDFETISNEILKEREQLQLSPFINLAYLKAEDSNPSRLRKFLVEAKKTLSVSDIEVYGPFESPVQKIGHKFKMFCIIQSANKNKLFMELDSFVKKVDENKKEISNWVVEFDPINAA